MPLQTTKEIAKATGIDFGYLGVAVAGMLPDIQSFLSIGVTFVILLIQIRRYRALNPKNKKNEEEKKD